MDIELLFDSEIRLHWCRFTTCTAVILMENKIKMKFVTSNRAVNGGGKQKRLREKGGRVWDKKADEGGAEEGWKASRDTERLKEEREERDAPSPYLSMSILFGASSKSI